MYYLLHEYDKALPYIQEAEFIMKQNEYYNQGNVYAIYGMIEFAKGNREQAVEYYKKGLSLNDINQTSYKVLLLNVIRQSPGGRREKQGSYRFALSGFIVY